MWVFLFLVLLVFFIFRLFAKENEDDFFARMSSYDLIARNATNVKDYQKLHNSAVRMSDVSQITKEADELLADYPLLYNIPWSISTISDDIENGYPHTLDTTIFMPKGTMSTETLIHEKIHVFQRLYPELTDRLIRSWGFTVSNMGRHPLQRNNPDLPANNYVFNGWVIFQKYNSKKPTSLADSHVVAINTTTREEKRLDKASSLGFPKYVKQIEHPYEIMACLLAHAITHKNELTSKVEVQAKEWLTRLQKY